MRLLAVALGCYFSLGLCRLSQSLSDAAAKNQALMTQKQELDRQISAQPCSEDQLRTWAFRQWGLVAPEDIVFFDGG
jgi:cell division protein FtsB